MKVVGRFQVDLLNWDVKMSLFGDLIQEIEGSFCGLIVGGWVEMCGLFSWKWSVGLGDEIEDNIKLNAATNIIDSDYSPVNSSIKLNAEKVKSSEH